MCLVYLNKCNILPSAVCDIGSASFKYDMRRLSEILAFPRAWYRRSIARRLFLGDQTINLPGDSLTNQRLGLVFFGLFQYINLVFCFKKKSTWYHLGLVNMKKKSNIPILYSWVYHWCFHIKTLNVFRRVGHKGWYQIHKINLIKYLNIIIVILTT